MRRPFFFFDEIARGRDASPRRPPFSIRAWARDVFDDQNDDRRNHGLVPGTDTFYNLDFALKHS
jgi:hypothetical protein